MVPGPFSPPCYRGVLLFCIYRAVTPRLPKSWYTPKSALAAGRLKIRGRLEAGGGRNPGVDRPIMIYLDGGKVGALDNWIGSVKTFEDARDFVMRTGVCCVLQNKKGEPNLYDAIDAPKSSRAKRGGGRKCQRPGAGKTHSPRATRMRSSMANAKTAKRSCAAWNASRLCMPISTAPWKS